MWHVSVLGQDVDVLTNVALPIAEGEFRDANSPESFKNLFQRLVSRL
jgi:hypothetical protein